MKSNNILVTSISSKVILLNLVKNALLKFDKDILLYGADINSNVIGAYFVDKFWKMPKLENLNIELLLKYCKKNNIKYIIPTRDEDLKYFSFYKDTLLKNKITVFCSNPSSIEFCFDKLKFYKNSQNKSVIPTFINIDKINCKKFVVKERFGSGSVSIAINVSKKEAKKFSKKLKNPIFQPFVEGQEYSIDSYVTKDNICIESIIRSRDLVIDGEAKITTIVKDKSLKKEVQKFLQQHKIQGHSVLQVIKSNNTYNIIECNARFGGASSLSYKMGLESFYWFLLEANSKDIKPKIKTNILKQIRISKDIYIES